MDKRYTLSVTETQLRAIRTALEEFFRLRMGQAWDLSEDIAFSGFDYESHDEKDFDNRLHKRDELQNAIEGAIRAARNYDIHYDIGDTARICEDVWQVIRHKLWQDNPHRSDWSVDSRPLLPVSDEPAARCIGEKLC